MSQQLQKRKKRQIRFEFLEKDKVEEAAKMVSEGFVNVNSIWKKLNTPYEEAYEFNKWRINQGCNTNWSFVKIH